MVVKWETNGSEVDYTTEFLYLGQTKPIANQTVPNSLEWYIHPYLGKLRYLHTRLRKWTSLSLSSTLKKTVTSPNLPRGSN